MKKTLLLMGVAGFAAACLLATGCAPASVSDSLIFPETLSEPLAEKVAVRPIDPLSLPAETLITPEELEADGVDAYFAVEEISDKLFERMYGKTYKDDCTTPREDLRYVRVLHANIDGEILTGEIVVNAAIADEICGIFRELFDARYPIERMRLADDYNADDIASMEDNNTSGFSWRPIEGTNRPSKHGLGMAVDINTFYNPYYSYSDGYVSPAASGEYLNRWQDFPYKIEEGDLCHRLFMEHGYTWGGYWMDPKDYQHFEK